VGENDRIPIRSLSWVVTASALVAVHAMTVGAVDERIWNV
jgi:hypothetical protein